MKDNKTPIIFIILFSIFVLFGCFLCVFLTLNRQTKEIPPAELYEYLDGEEIVKLGGITVFIHKKYNKLIYVNKKGDFVVTDFEKYYFLEEKTEEKKEGE